jgi:hypothetical protein
MEDVRQLSFVDEGETTGESLLYGGEGVRSRKKQRRTLDPLLNTGHSRAQSQSPPCYTILDYPQHATQQRIREQGATANFCWYHYCAIPAGAESGRGGGCAAHAVFG